MKEQIQEKALKLGFDLCRVTSADAPGSKERFLNWLDQQRHGEMGYLARNAHKRVDPQQVLANARSIIIVAASYARKDPVPDKPNTGIIARYAQYSDYHDVLASPLKELTSLITTLGGPETRALWYIDTGPLLERDLAQRAGIGFVGKHTNLISRELGNWFFLAEIITTLELPPDAPEHNRCGTCTRCIGACPTSAIVSPFELDARRCISYLTIELKGSIPEDLRPLLGNRIYGCDDCLAACPWNRFAKAGALMKAHAREDLTEPRLIELLSLDDAGFKQRFASSPILRTKRRGLLRNVCVALGNTGTIDALPALEKVSRDKEPIVVEHAQWAMDQILKRTTAPMQRPRELSGHQR